MAQKTTRPVSPNPALDLRSLLSRIPISYPSTSKYVTNESRRSTTRALCSKIHFQVNAGNKLAETHNLWMQGRTAVRLEIALSSTVADMLVKIVELFDIPEISSANDYGLRIAGFDCLLTTEDKLKLIDFDCFYHAYRTKSVINGVFEFAKDQQDDFSNFQKTFDLKNQSTFLSKSEVGPRALMPPEKEDLETTWQSRSTVVLPKVDRKHAHLHTGPHVEELMANFAKVNHDDIYGIRQLCNAVAGICSSIELVSIPTLLVGIEESKDTVEKKRLLSSLIHEQNRLAGMYKSTIKRAFPLEYEEKDEPSKMCETTAMNIPLSLKVESLHSLSVDVQNTKHLEIKVRLQKGTSSKLYNLANHYTSERYSARPCRAANIGIKGHVSVFPAIQFQTHLDIPAIVNLLPVDSYLLFELYNKPPRRRRTRSRSANSDPDYSSTVESQASSGSIDSLNGSRPSSQNDTLEPSRNPISMRRKRLLATGSLPLFDAHNSNKFNSASQIVPLKSFALPDKFMDEFLLVVTLPDVTIFLNENVPKVPDISRPISGKNSGDTDNNMVFDKSRYHDLIRNCKDQNLLYGDRYFLLTNKLLRTPAMKLWTRLKRTLEEERIDDFMHVQLLPVVFAACPSWSQVDVELMVEVLRAYDLNKAPNPVELSLGLLSLQDPYLTTFTVSQLILPTWTLSNYLMYSTILLESLRLSSPLATPALVQLLLQKTLNDYPEHLTYPVLFQLENYRRRSMLEFTPLSILYSILKENSPKFTIFQQTVSDLDSLFFIARNIREVKSKQQTLTRLLEDTCMTSNAQLTVTEDMFAYPVPCAGPGSPSDFSEDFTIVENKADPTSFRKTRNPLHMDMLECSIVPEKCRIFTSNAMPVSLCYFHESSVYSRVLLKSDPHYDVSALEDVAQDAAVANFIQVLDSIWLDAGLDLKVVTYKALAFGNDQGLVEIIGDGVAESLCEIQRRQGTFNDQAIFAWLEGKAECLKQFVYSCVGCCVMSYVVGLGDRHNDNVLLTRDGRLFHVDFGNAFGRFKTWGGINRDRAPFLLTGDMYYVLTKTNSFNRFVDLCQQAMSILRKNALTIHFFLRAMLSTPGVHDLNLENIEFVMSRLHLDKSDAATNKLFEELILKSRDDSFARINFLAHSVQQAMAISSAGLKSKTSTFQAEDDLENSNKKSAISTTKSDMDINGNFQIGSNNVQNFVKDELLVSAQVAKIDGSEIKCRKDTITFEFQLYIHRLASSEKTRQKNSSFIFKLYYQERKEKIIWSRHFVLNVDDSLLDIREMLSIRWHGVRDGETLMLEVLEDSSWIAKRTQIWLLPVGQLFLKKGEYLYRHWIPLQ